ncbi:DoxX family protein [Chryseobacterium sp. 3008163]|uniref:DoxX family protein n=1 Tax=Chryseobacterium sp. 3008163 TaxID=2478663 RepID=UPI000F0CF35B|nr:DoxX family protein [Chryseobacterium sp. 3008163]AYM99276.1 DoxX family protein [Chryseobacterium sp. 3008163]
MKQKTIKITGWVLTILIGLLLGLSASLKLIQSEETLAQAATIGIDGTTYFIIGIIEIVSLLLFIIPRTSIVGALLLAAYLGGAIATHLTNQLPVIMPISVQVLLWITAFIRFPELRQRLFVK